ncbi:MAG: nucleotide exchange factor GrpE [Planctomycetaceae bacterium]|nr:MAG: nucleotide exchange factor GrpE [Planctomycetaceae bacterium]
MMSDPQIHKPDSFDEVESPCEELSPDQIRIAELEDKLLRTQAELENFRKRSRREIEENFRYREMDLLRDILPILDSVSRAIEASKKVADVESLVSGFEMTSQQVLKVLASHGCSPIQTDGKQFDPSMHDAILQQEVPGSQPGAILAVASRGFMLHDRVVRPAQVIVAKEP